MDPKASLPLLDPLRVSELALDVWKLHRRTLREPSTPDQVRIAAELAVDRLISLGFELKDLSGEPFDENMRVVVVDCEECDGELRISECLSPAVYFQAHLIRPAEVILQGRGKHGTADR